MDDRVIMMRKDMERLGSPNVKHINTRFRLTDSFVTILDIDEEHFSDMFSDTSVECLTRIAENNSIPSALLEQLAYHPSSSVRIAIADNCNTPIDALWLLAYDECADVRYALAENHNMPLAILSALMEDENPYVVSRALSTIDRLLSGTVLDAGFWDVYLHDDYAAG